ncbi:MULTISPECIES: hypothetical protein [Enterobacter]|nr:MULTISPECIES: hypothetical protein [Enterobacter cloacae complex]MDT9877476.1 hypothetical protein [Enterobacter cloacae]
MHRALLLLSGYQSADEAVEGRCQTNGHHGHEADLRQRRRVGTD